MKSESSGLHHAVFGDFPQDVSSGPKADGQPSHVQSAERESRDEEPKRRDQESPTEEVGSEIEAFYGVVQVEDVSAHVPDYGQHHENVQQVRIRGSASPNPPKPRDQEHETDCGHGSGSHPLALELRKAGDGDGDDGKRHGNQLGDKVGEEHRSNTIWRVCVFARAEDWSGVVARYV